MSDRPRRRGAFLVVPLLVVAVAAGLRLADLGRPPAPYFDEQWYAFDAYAYLGGSVALRYPAPPPPVAIADEETWVHPPLGKWLIAAGEGPLGFNSVGWRLPPALFGIAGVLFAYLLGLALFESPWWAGLGALLLAVDGLHLVMSRMAMLDIFLATFVTLGALLLALDRIRGPADRASRVARWFGSGYRLGAGLALGAAVAVKWSGALALLLAAVLCASGFLDRDRPGAASARTRTRWTLAAFVLVPLGVYLVSYAQFWLQHGPAFRSFAVLQWRMLQFQLHDKRIYPGTSNTSNPLTWPLLLHPVQFLRIQDSSSGSAPILGLGNPLVWWGFLVLAPVAFVSWLRRAREWRTGFLLALFAVMYAPWLFVGRVQYLFYMLPAVPFMCLLSARGLRTLPDRMRNAVASGYAALAVVTGIAFLPVWIGFQAPWSGALGWLPGWR